MSRGVIEAVKKTFNRGRKFNQPAIPGLLGFNRSLRCEPLEDRRMLSVVTLYPNADTFIDSNYPTSNYGGSTGLLIGKPWGGGERMDRVSFSGIPSGATINSATLYLYRYSGEGAFTLSVQSASRSWSENTLTWDTDGSTARWTTPESTYYMGSTTGSLSVDVTTHVQEWADGTRANYGFQLSTDDSWTVDPGNTRAFYSSEYSTESYRPRLVIDYDAGTPNADLNLSNIDWEPAISAEMDWGDNPTHIDFDVYSYSSSDSLSSDSTLVHMYLSDDTTHGDSDDVYLGNITVSWTQSPGTTKNLNFSSTGLSYISIPDGTANGDYYVYAHMTPQGGEWVETDDNDNWERTDSEVVRVYHEIDDPNDQISEAIPFTKPAPGEQTQPGNAHIDNPTDVDMWQVSVNTGDQLAFDLDDVQGYEFDSYLRLFDSSGNQLDYSDDDQAPGESSGNDAYLEYTFTSPGTYYVGISGWSNTSYNPITGTGDSSGSTGMCSFYVTNLTQPVPSPDIVEVTYPSSIAIGNWADIEVLVKNTGGTSIDGGLSVSIPSFTSTGDGAYINDNGSSSDCVYAEHPRNTQVYHKNGSIITANYMLAEWVDNNFTNNETNTFRFRVKPKSTGSFVFNVRSALSADETNYFGDPTSGPLDQQGWWVQQYTINVEPLPSPDILEVTYPSSIAIGNWADIEVRVKNTGGTSIDGGLSVSIPSFTSTGDGAYINDNGSSSDCVYAEYPRNSQVYHKNGSIITTNYMLAEWVDNNFTNNETNTFRFRVKPESSGSFVFNVRSALSADETNYFGDPTSGPLDQQGWWVQQYTIDVLPTAQIASFAVPTGTIARDSQTQTTVRVKNNDSVARSYWVGLSFAHETATLADWPANWYDIKPQQTSLLQPGAEQDVTFTFTVFRNLKPGQYYAEAATWTSFNSDKYLMEGEIDRATNYDQWRDGPNGTGETAFILGGFDTSYSALEEFSYFSSIAFNGDITVNLRKPQGALKPLLYVEGSVGGNTTILVPTPSGVPIPVPVTGNAKASFLIDLVDLLTISPEGEDGWVTCWIDVGGYAGLGWTDLENPSPVSIDVGIIPNGIDWTERCLADDRRDWELSPQLRLPGFAVTLTNFNLLDPEFEFNGSADLSLGISGESQGLVSFEFQRSLLISAMSGSYNSAEAFADLVGLCLADNQSLFRAITWDDGDWLLNDGQWESDLKLTEAWNDDDKYAHYFSFDVPAGTSGLQLNTSGGTGNADLYLRFGQRPTTSSYDFRSQNTGNTESIMVPNPQAGRWYIMVPTTSSYDGVNLVASIVSNQAPTIGSLSDSPDPVTQPNNLTLTANSVLDSDGTVEKVEFYRDSNNNGSLDVGTDQLLGTDSSSSGEWNWTGTTGGFPTGTNRFFARAQDDDQAWSNVVTTTVMVEDAADECQKVWGTPNPCCSQPGSEVTFTAQYTTSDNNNLLSGLGLRMHYDSSFYTVAGPSFDSFLSTGLVGQSSPTDDNSDYDNNPDTDKFVLISWADIAPPSDWPGGTLPVNLFDATFTLADALPDGATSVINFTASDTADGYEFDGQPVIVNAQSCSLDVDVDGEAKALTDGLIILRYLFGYPAEDFVDVMGGNAQLTPGEIERNLDGCRPDGILDPGAMLDPDGNGEANALTDGLIILRYLFGYPAEDFVDVMAGDAQRTPGEIVAFLDKFMPASGAVMASASKSISLESVIPVTLSVASNTPTAPLAAQDSSQQARETVFQTLDDDSGLDAPVAVLSQNEIEVPHEQAFDWRIYGAALHELQFEHESWRKTNDDEESTTVDLALQLELNWNAI